MINRNLEKIKFITHDKITIAKIIDDENKFNSIILIQFKIFNNYVNYIKKCLIKSFNNVIRFRIFKLKKFSHDFTIDTINIKDIIFIFFIIINIKTIDFNIIMLVASLITFKNEKDIIFKFNDLGYRALNSII